MLEPNDTSILHQVLMGVPGWHSGTVLTQEVRDSGFIDIILALETIVHRAQVMLNPPWVYWWYFVPLRLSKDLKRKLNSIGNKNNNIYAKKYQM